MPTRTGYAEGTPSWVDLATPNLEGAKTFYNALFGWGYNDGGDESMPYTMAMQKDEPAAGIAVVMGGEMPTVWSTYFAVDNADATVEKIKSAGGSIVMECMDIFDSGRMAFAADPTGAVFGIWQAGEHTGAGIVNEHGALNWNELLSDDLDSALAFYSEVFGHTYETADTPNGPYTAISVGDRAVAGAMPKPMPDIPNSWGPYFAVDDTVKATEVAVENGGSVVFGPMEIPDVGKFAGLADPYGAHFTVIQLAQPVD